MSKYISQCGKAYELPYKGKYARCLIGRSYPEGDKEEHPVPLRCQECMALKVKDNISLMDDVTNDFYPAIDTYCLLINQEYREYPPVNHYCEACSNTTLQQMAEITLQAEEWRAVIYKQFDGNCSFYDHITDIADELWEELYKKESLHSDEDEDDVSVVIWMSTEDGRNEQIEISDANQLENMIASIRLVAFREIEEKNNEIITESGDCSLFKGA